MIMELSLGLGGLGPGKSLVKHTLYLHFEGWTLRPYLGLVASLEAIPS